MQIMDEIELEIGKVLSDQRELEKLLLLEKEKRGVDNAKLVFIGMADIAQYYWCAMKSLLKSKEMELAFFSCYLYDRFLYSFHLGFINRLPKSKKELLEVGSEVTFTDIEKLLKERAKIDRDIHVRFDASTIIDKNGNDVMVINPDLSQEEIIYYEEEAKSKGIRIASPEKYPLIRGELLENTKAEKYPTIRWNFDWNDYVVVGVPDGITDSFVYEFKTTRSRFFMYYIKPVALTQADIYGYFFKRAKKRVQIYIVDEKITETGEDKVRQDEALKVLKNFKKVDEGWTPPSPKIWKCKSCEFKDICKLLHHN